MLGRSGNKGKGIPKGLPLAEKQNPIPGKLAEVLASVKEINRLLTEELRAEFKSYEALAARQALIAKAEGILEEAKEQMMQISGIPISGSESQPPLEPQIAAPAPETAEPIVKAIRPTSLGQKLVEAGIITQSQLAAALIKKAERGGFLGQILVEMGIVKQDVVVQFLVKECKIPHLSLLDYEIEKEVLELVPKEFCLRRKLLPIEKIGRILTIAMCDPLDIEALEEIRKLHPELRLKSILCNWQHFKTITAKLFGAEDEQTK